MKKKILVMTLCLLLVCSLGLGLVACDKGGDQTPTGGRTTPVTLDYSGKTVVLTLGDSIAEALAGPSPVSERENYGYYALLGKGNGFFYVNHSVSGWKSDQLLDYVSRDGDTGADINYTLIKDADIISLSILGNDLLQDNLGKLLTQLANFIVALKSIDGNSEMTYAQISDYIHEHKSEANFGIPTSVPGYDSLNYIAGLLYNGEGSRTTVNNMKFTDNSTTNFAAVVERLFELNPDVKLTVQTIYNPVFDTSSLVTDVDTKTKDGDVIPNTNTRYVLGEQYGINAADYRALGDILIEMLNNVIRDYAAANTDKNIVLIDVHDEFEAYYAADTSTDKIYARRLFSQDYIHPSNEGHAMIADVSEAALVKKGWLTAANQTAYVASTKAIRCEQLDRMYTYANCAVDAAAAKAAVNAATTAAAANKAYFDAVTSSTYATAIANRDKTARSKPEAFYPWVIPNYCGNIG